MLYFLNIANSPEDFGEFFIEAWKDMVSKEVIINNKDNVKELNLDKAMNYEFSYKKGFLSC